MAESAGPHDGHAPAGAARRSVVADRPHLVRLVARLVLYALLVGGTVLAAAALPLWLIG